MTLFMLLFLPLLVHGSDRSEGTCFRDCRDHVKKEFAARDTELENLKSRLDMRDSQVESLQREIEELKQTLTLKHEKKRASGQEVGFSASISGSTRSVTLGTNRKIVFTHVLTNIGSHYDSRTGIFSAPASGTYQFFVNVMADMSNYIETRLMRNGGVIAEIYSGAIQNYGTGSNHVVVRLNRGDHVWVQVNGGVSSNFKVHCCWSTFSGYLLHA